MAIAIAGFGTLAAGDADARSRPRELPADMPGRGLLPPGVVMPRAGDAPARSSQQRVAESRPSAAAIEAARRQNGLPPSARAVGWRLVDSGARKVWRIIFRVGNRQVAVEVPAGG